MDRREVLERIATFPVLAGIAGAAIKEIAPSAFVGDESGYVMILPDNMADPTEGEIRYLRDLWEKTFSGPGQKLLILPAGIKVYRVEKS